MRARFRETWDTQTGGLKQVLATFEASGVPFPPPLPSVLIFTKQLLFFHRPLQAGEASRVATLAEFIIATARLTDPAQSYLGAALAGGAEASAWASQVSQLLGAALTHMSGHLSGSRPLPGILTASLVSLVDTIATCPAWPLVAPGGSPLSLTFEPVRSAVLSVGGTGSLFEALRAAPLEDPAFGVLMRLSLLALGVASPDGTLAPAAPASLAKAEHVSLERFASVVLADHALPALPLAAPLAAALTGQGAEAWWRLVSAAQDASTSKACVGGTGALSAASSAGSDKVSAPPLVVGNLLALTGGRLAEMEAGVTVERVRSLVALLRAHVATLPVSAFAADVTPSAQDDDDEEEEGGAEEDGPRNGIKGLEMRVKLEHRRAVVSRPTAAAEVAVGSAPGARSGDAAVLTALARPATLSFLFNSTLPPVETSCESFDETAALDLCATYGEILTRAPVGSRCASAVVHALSLGRTPSFLPRFWAFLTSQFAAHTSPREAAAMPGGGAAGVAAELEDVARATLAGAPGTLLSSMVLFCSVFSRVLVTVNDDDFLDRGVPFSVRDQRAVSAMLKGHLFELLWEAPVADSGRLESLQLLLAEARLFNQLYDRHARRDFERLPRAHFHWPSVVSKELNDAMDGANVFGSRRMSLVLTVIPQVLPFDQRVRIFQGLVEADKDALGLGDAGFVFGSVVHDLTVTRERIYEDAFAGLNHLGPNLKVRQPIISTWCLPLALDVTRDPIGVSGTRARGLHFGFGARRGRNRWRRVILI